MRLTEKVDNLEYYLAKLCKWTGLSPPTKLGKNQDINKLFEIGRYTNVDATPINVPAMFQDLVWVLEVRYWIDQYTFTHTIITEDNRRFRRIFNKKGWTCWKEC